MSRMFAYSRVAPASKPIAAIELRKAAAAAGHTVLPDHTVIETVVSSVALFTLPDWRGLLEQMHEGDVLVVLALSDLGCNVKDVCVTVRRLAASGLRVHCLALGAGLGRVDLASPAGRPTMEVLAVIADFEEKLRIERERLVVARPGLIPTAPTSVRRKGRPPSLSSTQVAEARRLLAAGVSTVQIAQRLGTSRQTIMRACKRQRAVMSKSSLLDGQ